MRAEDKTNRKKDDSLFGLLSSYKSNVTYMRILISEELKKIEIQMTDNPKNWETLSTEAYKKYRVLRRLEAGLDKLSVKYIKPDHLVSVMGDTLNIKIPSEKIFVKDKLDSKGLYHITTQLKYKNKIIQGVRKIINLSPQKKYEIIEKSLVKFQEKHNDRAI